MFSVLAIVNSAAMNMRVHVSFSILVSSGYMPSSGIRGPYGGFIPSVLRNSILFSMVALSIYIPRVQESSLFSIPSPAFIACRLLDRSHSDWHEMVPHSGFDLHFSDNE